MHYSNNAKHVYALIQLKHGVISIKNIGSGIVDIDEIIQKRINERDNAYENVLINWINNHNLSGKKVIEFACGVGKAGVILSQQKCVYYGVDKSQSFITQNLFP